jgi:hypothetical protein
VDVFKIEPVTGDRMRAGRTGCRIGRQLFHDDLAEVRIHEHVGFPTSGVTPPLSCPQVPERLAHVGSLDQVH